MAYNPYILYAVVERTIGKEPLFATIEERSESSHSIGMFEGVDGDCSNITVVWYDFEKKKTYFCTHVPDDDSTLQTVVFMVLANGGCVMWLTYINRTVVFTNFQCEKTTLSKVDSEWEQKRVELQLQYESHRQDLSADAMAFFRSTQTLMRRYTYRLWPVVGGEKEIEMTVIKVFLSDGTIKYLDEREMFDYRYEAKLNKLYVRVVCEESDYDLYFWLDEGSVFPIFERFYGSHPETKADFIIRIDVENKKYELALYRQGLKEPVVIPESAYQLIVFKNKFEDYRSENYNQPRGAWIW